MNKIAEKRDRSSRVPFTVIHKHNNQVLGIGVFVLPVEESTVGWIRLWQG